MADNTRKTSNIIHEVADLNSTVNNLAQNIENNTESIGNIKVYDSHIWLSTSKGLTVTQDGNTTTNNDQPTEWKLEADTDYLNTTLNFAKSDEIPSVYVKDIKSGDVTTLTVEEEDGVYTLTAIGGGGGGSIENITLAEGTCIKIDSEQYDDNGTTKTRLTINTDTDCLNTTLNFAKPDDIGDGNITLKSTDGSVSITGQNATANQATDTAWDLSVNIPTPPTPITPGDGTIKLAGGTGIDVTGANGTANQTSDSSQTISIDDTVALKSDIPAPVVPGDGNITLTEGDGIKVSGSDATANQTGDTAWTVKTDDDYLNANLNFAKTDQIPTDLGVLTIENITPHANGNFDFQSSDDALVVDSTAHGLSLSINEDKLPFVKDIKSGNDLTLTVADDGNGTVTLTAAGGGGGAGNIAFAGGKCIDVDKAENATTNITTYTINNDLECLNSSLGFATDQDIADAIGDIVIPEKTSQLENDGADGVNPFITAADIPDVPDSNLPISSTDATVTIDGGSNIIDLQCNDASEESSPRVYFRGYVKDGVNASDEPTTVRHGFIQGYLAPEAVNKGQYQSNVGIWSQLGAPPYNRTEADLEVTYDGNVVINNGQVQTDTITSKDGLVNGPFIELGDDKAIRLRTNFSERVVLDEDGTLISQMGTTPIGENRTAYKINETGNTGENSFSIDWTFANGGFVNTDAQGRIGVRREGLEAVGGSANFSMEFFVASRPSGTSESDVLTKALEIRYDGQLIAKDGYEPEEDNSLVTKSWVQANGAGGSGTLPISSADGYTTLDALNVSEFSVRAKTTKLYNQTSDDVKLILHHNKSWVEGDGACYLYAGDTAGGRVGVGTGCTIAVGRTIANPDYIPPDDPDNPRPPEYDDTTPATIIESHDSFRVCPEHGNVALGDTITGAATNGVFARWDSRSLATNFVTYCDVATIPDVPKAVNPDYIADIDSRPEDYDPATPEYILDPDATAEELKQYVSVMYGHWSQINSLNSVSEAGGAPLTTVNFFAVPNAQTGLKTISKGFLHQSEAKVTDKSYGFESQQTVVAGVQTYAFYASGSAPSRFNGGVHTDTITTKAAAAGDASIELGANATISTGGAEKVKVSNSSFLLRTDDINLIRANATFPPNSGNNINNKQMLMLKNTSKDGGRFAGLSFVHVFDSGTAGASGSIGMRDDNDGFNGTMLFTLKGETGTQTIDVLEATKDHAKFNVDVQTSRIVGSAAPDTDASIELGTSAKIQTEANNAFVVNPAGQAYGVLHTARNNSVTAHATRPFIQNINANNSYNVRQTVWEYTTIDLLSGDGSNPYKLNDYFSQALPNKVDSYRGFSVGGYDPALMQATEAVGCYLNVGLPNDGREWYSLWCDGAAPARFDCDVQASKIVGPDASDASIELGAELLTSNHTPTQPNSIATKQYVDESFSGGGVGEDTVPGSGANFRWNEKLIAVPYEINGTIQNNRQVFSQLYAYDGIFTDGLHWTADGYAWHTSDQSLTQGQLSAYQGNDLGRVCKGNGNEYVTSRYISNDMKSWRIIGGSSGAGVGIVYLGGEIYASDGRYILNRQTNAWESTGTGFWEGGSLSSSPNPAVACQESGLYALTVSISDGTVHWTVALVPDEFPSPYQAVPGITGAISCLFSERLRKWMVATTDTLWITDGENLSATNWTSMALPTAGNWDRMVDDGGTISIASTDDNANIVLYCQEENGPTSTADWQTTTLYNNRGYDGFCGTNGRTIGSMEYEGTRTDPETGDRFNDYYYAISGDVRLENTVDTSQINLASPTRDLRDLNPPTGLKTQSDANQFMAAEIAKRAVVVTLTQAEYDAIPADEIDENTLYLIT